MKEYKVVIIGAGPAGIAPLFYLDNENRLDDYIENGICIIEKSNDLGVGKFKDYNIYANTASQAFLEIFSNNSSDSIYKIKQRQSYSNLINKQNSSFVKLTEIGDLYKDYGKLLKERIDKNKHSDVFCQSESLNIQKHKNGYSIKYKDLENDQQYEVFGENIILNLGGEHNRTYPSNKVITVADLLTNNIVDKIDELLEKNHQLLVVGNSHSAMSIISSIIKSEKFSSKHEVSIIGRKEIKLYYENEKLAKQDKYKYDLQEDVCKITQRINRYSGMRGESFITAKKIINNEVENIRHYIEADIKGESDFFQAEVIIDCTGYQSKMIPIFDASENLIPIAQHDGIIQVNDRFNPINKQGEPILNIYTYGLGVGILPGKEIGGEAAFNKRIDGVWLYQHFVAPKIIANIENRQLLIK